MKSILGNHIPSKLNLQALDDLSYPAEARFDRNFRTGDYLNAIISRRQMARMRPLAMYVQLPFLAGDFEKEEGSQLFFDYLKREINTQSYLFLGMNHLTRLHFLGGINGKYIHCIEEILNHIKNRFTVDPGQLTTLSIELNPASSNVDHIKILGANGFNCITLAGNTFNADIDSGDKTLQFADTVKQAGIDTINVKLSRSDIFSSKANIDKIVHQTLALHPRQIQIEGFVSYLTVEEMTASTETDSIQNEVEIFQYWIDSFAESSYVYLGMGYWVKRYDELAIAQTDGRLNLNCYGYATHVEDIISFGMAAISNIGGVYSKNAETLSEYYTRIEEQNLPIVKGIKLKTNDLLRRSIIHKLLCEGEITISFIEITYPINFDEYFAKELAQLEQLANQQLVQFSFDTIRVTAKGQFFIYSICQIFDTY